MLWLPSEHNITTNRYVTYIILCSLSNVCTGSFSDDKPFVGVNIHEETWDVDVCKIFVGVDVRDLLSEIGSVIEGSATTSLYCLFLVLVFSLFLELASANKFTVLECINNRSHM